MPWGGRPTPDMGKSGPGSDEGGTLVTVPVQASAQSVEDRCMGGCFLLRVGLPVVMALLLAATVFYAFFSWSTRSIDTVSVERQRELASVVIGQLRSSVSHEQESVTVWDDAVNALRRGKDTEWIDGNLGTWMYTFFQHNATFILDPRNRPLYAYRNDEAVPPETFRSAEPVVAPMLAELRRKMRRGDTSGVDDRFLTPGVSDFAMVDGHPAAVSLKPIVSDSGRIRQTPGREFVHIAIRYLDGAFLTELSRNYLFADLHFSVERVVGKHQEALPLRRADGRTLGYFIWSPYLPGHDFAEQIRPILVVSGVVLAFCALGGLWLAYRGARTNLAHKDHIYRLAHFDSLTGLPNRPSFERRLSDLLFAVRPGVRQGAVIYIDLDHFKDVNDTLGHAAGDQVVRLVARRLGGLLASGGSAFRLGGDEFVVLLRQDDAVEIGDLCKRIVQVLQEPCSIRGRQVHISGSVGVALFPEHGRDHAELMRKADVALYAAKTTGRNRYAVFAPEMDRVLNERSRLEQDLRAALVDRSGIAIHYQPKYRASDYALVSAEALVRWNRPGVGWMPPAQFIPAAEASGAIMGLGLHVLEEACRAARHWPLERVAVNVSPVQLRDPGFADTVRNILRRSGLPPQRLELEVTESSWLDETGNSSANLRELRGMGVLIALDDFGTGFSSFGRLYEAEVDRIKIDQSFIRGAGDSPGDMAIVQAIVDMARAKNLKTTAEGVETAQIARALGTIGCDELQGYFFSRPVAAEDITAMLRVEHRGESPRVLQVVR